MAATPFVCASCAHSMRLNALALALARTARQSRRHLSRSVPPSSLPAHDAALRSPDPRHSQNDAPRSSKAPDADTKTEPGAMTSRLQQATEDALLTGGRAGRRAIEDAGFSEELKAKLLDKVAGAKFGQEHAAALSHAGVTSRIPDSAGLGTRTMASGEAWTGQEPTGDAVLRMLDDARKPLAPGLRRGKSKPPVPVPVDMRLRREIGMSPGRKVAGARDKAHAYAGMGAKDKGLNEEEREAMRREFRERFAPAARAMPNTVTGLAALANERIEDAIARGQFKNIPRGKGVERDRRADNPFIDTTEYIMNKMIKRQDMVPPWIEKQQELIKAAANFRGRLRNDWKRYAARMISARGGTLEQQVARAVAHARAEEIHNPRRRNPEQMSVPTNSTEDVVMTAALSPSLPPPSPSSAGDQQPAANSPPGPAPEIELAHPFRDPAWEAAERSYMTLAIENLNTITRSYNLMAPELAKKPYFSLDRELRNCFADVAPEVPGEIRLRATRPAKSLEGTFGGARKEGVGRGLGGGGMGGLFHGGDMGEGLGGVEGREKRYGLKEFWRDLWGK